MTGLQQPETVTIQAAPNTGIMTLKQGGQTTFDTGLEVSTSTPVASYSWDFNGTGSNELRCYNHSSVNASYEEAGLYLTQVNMLDTAGNSSTDTAIVNVLDYSVMNSIFTQKWTGMLSALGNGDISSATGYFNPVVQSVFNQRFSAIALSLPQFILNMGPFNLERIIDSIAEGDLRITKDGVTYSFQVLFIRDENGTWGILSF